MAGDGRARLRPRTGDAAGQARSRTPARRHHDLRRDVEQLIDRKGKAAYRAAVHQLRHIHTLATLAGQPETFAAILERVRTQHRLKRTLMSFLEAAKLD